MRSELIQQIDNHLQFYGYESKWSKSEDDSETLLARHAGSRPNWTCVDFLGGVQMITAYGTTDYARENSEKFIGKINAVNGGGGPLSFHVDPDDASLLWGRMFVMQYDKTSFGKLVELAETILRAYLEDEGMSVFMQ